MKKLTNQDVAQINNIVVRKTDLQVKAVKMSHVEVVNKKTPYDR